MSNQAPKREYYDRRGKKHEVVILPRKERLECIHDWRRVSGDMSNWKSICKKCGAMSRGIR
jgi:hypothetical protein